MLQEHLAACEMSPSLRRRNATEATDAAPALAAALAAAPPQHVSIREPQDTREAVARLADRLDLAEEELLRFADAGAALGDAIYMSAYYCICVPMLLCVCPHILAEEELLRECRSCRRLAR